MTVEGLVRLLCAELRTTDEARRPPSEGGVPSTSGLYAWWSPDLEEVGEIPLPFVQAANARLLYVGISPVRAGSRQTLRGRVCGNHLRGRVSSSTFRLSLAALLWQQEGWLLARSGNTPLLSPPAHQALAAWQRTHLRVSWAVHPKPWEVERSVVKAMAPPFNLAGNRTSALSWTLSEARQRFRSAALSGNGPTAAMS